jgi:HK97 family phage major capsid protein
MTDSERRAMSLTDTSGGFLVPFQLDPTVIITSDGSFNQIRTVARKVIATGDVWNGVSSGHVSWSWDNEAAEVSDDATTFAQPSITIRKARGFVPISEEALADEANVASEVGRLLMSGKEELESVAFATGSGSEPVGIVTALVASSPSVVVAAETNNAFVAGDVYALDEGLPARYRFRASWLANRAIYNRIRQFDTSGGGALWERLGADVPPQLLGKNAYEAEGMDGALATANDYCLIFGDFDNYVIADRIGTTVRFIPDLFHVTTNLPSGQSGWYAYYRVGADSVNDGAFRLLRV